MMLTVAELISVVVPAGLTVAVFALVTHWADNRNRKGKR